MNYLKIAKRMLALFLVTALATIGAGAVIGINVIQTAILAGVMGIANVVEDLARGYLNDGNLSDEEIDAAFVDNIPEFPKVGVEDKSRGWFTVAEYKDLVKTAKKLMDKKVEWRMHSSGEGGSYFCQQLWS